jgi:hypothetical protein
VATPCRWPSFCCPHPTTSPPSPTTWLATYSPMSGIVSFQIIFSFLSSFSFRQRASSSLWLFLSSLIWHHKVKCVVSCRENMDVAPDFQSKTDTLGLRNACCQLPQTGWVAVPTTTREETDTHRCVMSFLSFITPFSPRWKKKFHQNAEWQQML